MPIPSPPSTSSIPATIGPPNSADMAENEPAVESTAVSRSPTRTSRVAATPTTDPSAMTGASGPSTAPKERLPERRERDAGGVRERRRFHAQSLARVVAAVAGQPAPRDQHDQRAGDRQPEDQVPGGRVAPQPVLELVDDAEEARGEQGGGDADRGPERH